MNKLYDIHNNKNYFSGFDSDDGQLKGNTKFVKGSFKIKRDSTFYLQFVYNGYNRKLFIFEKNNLENKMMIDLD